MTQNSFALGQSLEEENAYKETRFILEAESIKSQIPTLLQVELSKPPLSLDQETLAIHLKKLMLYHEWVLRKKSALIDAEKLNDQLCCYTYRFINAIHALSSKEVFLEKIGMIHQVVRTLQSLSEKTFTALHDILISIAKIDVNQPMYRSDWKFFCQIELMPLLNALEDYLMKRGLVSNLQSKMVIASELMTLENHHAFQPLFSQSVEFIPSTLSTSFNPTPTQ